MSRAALFVGTVLTVLTLAKLHAARRSAVPYDLTNSSRFGWTLVYIAFLAVAAYATGLPDLLRTRRGALMAALASTVAASVAISVAQLVIGSLLLPRFVVFGSAVILTPYYVLCSRIFLDGNNRAGERDRVIVVGSWADAATLSLELEHNAERPARVVDVLSLDQVTNDGEGSYLVEAATIGDANVVVLDREAQLDHRVVAQAAELHQRGVRVRTLSLFYEEWLAKLPVSELERVSMMFDIGEIHRARYGRVKRIIDLAIASIAAVALVVIVPLVFLANLLANRGPLFFRQTRVGRRGREFTILKFRTMLPDGDDRRWTAHDDPRITRVGRLLRRTHLDELPQVVNILRGDLAVVGPRPEQPHYVDELRLKLPFYDLRHLVRPGLTGWAQVKYGYAGDETDALEKLQYEFYYLRRQSLAFDARIVVRTIRTICGGRGR